MKKLGRKFISFNILHHLEGESWADLKEKAYDSGYDNEGTNYTKNDSGYLDIYLGNGKTVECPPSKKANKKFYEKVRDALFAAYEEGKSQALQGRQDYSDYVDTVAHEYNSSRRL